MTDTAVKVSLLGLVAIFLLGGGFLLYLDLLHTTARQTECLSHGMQFVEMDCVK